MTPLSPFTHLIVKFCPFNQDAPLLMLNTAVQLFAGHGFDYVDHTHA